MTRFRSILSGLLLLALLGYFVAFHSHTERPKPMAVARPQQVSVKPQGQNGELPKPKHIARTGKATVPPNQVAVAPDAVSSEQSEIPEGDALMPLAFIDPPAELTSSDEQLAEFDYLRQQFVELVGGPDQDPATPGYRRRWDEAQRQLDEQFEAFFGLEAFNEQQGKAVRQAGQATGP